MRYTVQSQTLGEIVYEESFFSGKRQLWVNGTPLKMQDKRTFVCSVGEQICTLTLSGNICLGVNAQVGNEALQLVPAPKWYEWALSAFYIVLVMIWGNSPALCSIVPIVGGAIGGAISGGMAIISLVLIRDAKSPAKKLLLWAGMLVITLAICALVGLAILSAIS